jgi:hypothetical protein
MTHFTSKGIPVAREAYSILLPRDRKIEEAPAFHSGEVLLQLCSSERCESFFLGWGMQDVAPSKVFGL